MYISRQKWAWIVLGLVFIALIFFTALSKIFPETSVYLPAKDSGYVITDYDVDIDVSEQKILHINENITVDFLEYSHGIYRYIPIAQTITYQDKDGNVQSRDYRTAISNFKLYSNSFSIVETEKSDNYMFYALGTTSHYIKGVKAFNFSYDLNLGDDFDEIEDCFYFNIIGTGWDTDIENVDFSITFPTNIESQDFKFYVGRYGEDFAGDTPRVTYTKTGNTLTGNSTNLEYGEAVTTFTIFEEGYFKPQKSYLYDILLLVLTLTVLGLILLLFFKERRTTPLIEVVKFKAPEGITPTEAGYINDGSVTGDDISSLIVYWASKGYVRLETIGKHDVLIQKLSPLPKNANGYEKTFFNEIFKDGDEVKSSSLSSISPEVGLNCKKSVEVKSKIYFKEKNEVFFGLLSLGTILTFGFHIFKIISQDFIKVSTAFLIFAMGIIFTVAIMAYPQAFKLKDKLKKSSFVPLIIFNLIAIFAPLIVMAYLTNSRFDFFFANIYLFVLPIALVLTFPFIERYTEKGKKLLGEIRGLKNYILLAQKDKLEMMVEKNPSLFYEVLPYAYVLGVSDVYMNKFKDVAIGENQNFVYDDSLGLWFSFYLINHSLRHASRGIARTMHTFHPHDGSNGSSWTSSGGGFSSGGGGGGFSGGGFGGGGGGRF